MADRSEAKTKDSARPHKTKSKKPTEIPLKTPRHKSAKLKKEDICAVQMKLDDAASKFELYANEIEKLVKKLKLYELKFERREIKNFQYVMEQAASQMKILVRFEDMLNSFEVELLTKEERNKDLVEIHKPKIDKLKLDLDLKRILLRKLMEEVDVKYKFFVAEVEKRSTASTSGKKTTH
ncbi:uncharacterized protein LOC143470839 [Clavelina lepadiformis]|uniref:Uncharacterized protein n=1 Tax=Clavelina lepadiformis TaxID=159417 RepID=A0ABP0FKN4_CLALP